MRSPRASLTRSVGDMQQIAGAELFETLDGPERGVRKLLVRNGSGLAFTVNLDRGFDLGEASFKGINLTWRSPSGAVHPHAAQEAGGWLRRFPGGLLTTCGLGNVGPAELDRPLHGRHSNTPACLVTQRSFWEGDSYITELVGIVRDYALFGPNLTLTRSLRSSHDRAEITVRDRVTNESFEAQPFMLLYHCNIGYPLLDGSATLELNGTLTPRDETAAAALDGARRLHEPRASYREQVFLADLETHKGMCAVTVRNPALDLGISLRFAKTQLPHFTLWKQLGEGAYVLGLEPGTCSVLGFSRERELGRVLSLAPGASYEAGLTFSLVTADAQL